MVDANFGGGGGDLEVCFPCFVRDSLENFGVETFFNLPPLEPRFADIKGGWGILALPFASER